MSTVPKRCLQVVLLLALLWLAFEFLSPSARLRAAQASFLKAISAKDAETCEKLLAENYEDQWGFTRADWPLILQDLRMLAPILEVTGDFETGDAEGELVGVLHVSASGSPAVGVISEETGDWKAPTQFFWKRSGWQPWSWRLERIENPDIESPPGYRPGKWRAGF